MSNTDDKDDWMFAGAIPWEHKVGLLPSKHHLFLEPIIDVIIAKPTYVRDKKAIKKWRRLVKRDIFWSKLPRDIVLLIKSYLTIKSIKCDGLLCNKYIPYVPISYWRCPSCEKAYNNPIPLTGFRNYVNKKK